MNAAAGQELAKVEAPGALARQEDFGISVDALVVRVDKVREVSRRVMKEGVHFGNIPGTAKDKKTLLKPGAEVLCMAFQLAPTFSPDERREGEHLEVVMTCTLTHIPTGTVLGNGIGSCSTRESKYAWRKGERSCPKCGKATIRKSTRDRAEWYCWRKIDGCGATFKIDDKSITEQQVGRIPNPDIADMYNTVRKMACKRAHIAATLFVTGASELFTQDVEDMQPGGHDDAPEDSYPDEGSEGTPPVGRAATPPRAAAPAARPATSPVQGVPTSQDLEREIEKIRGMRTVEDLKAHAAASRGKRWSKTQTAELAAAANARLADLTNPDLREPPVDGGDDEIPF
jgi:hypothetical protein